MDKNLENNDYNNFIVTEKQTQTETQSNIQDFSKQADLPPKSNFEDDYSVNQNFEEEKGYEIKKQTIADSDNLEINQSMNMPTIEQEEKVVSLPEKKVNINARMKLVLASFIVIVTSLMFATIWNFIQVNKINSSIADRNQNISELQISISKLTGEYNMLDDIEYLKSLASNAGYIEANESNSMHISLDEMYNEETVEKIPSNWFNDVCEFITSLFGW